MSMLSVRGDSQLDNWIAALVGCSSRNLCDDLSLDVDLSSCYSCIFLLFVPLYNTEQHTTLVPTLSAEVVLACLVERKDGGC